MLGAGFSYNASGGKLPVMQGFFSRVSKDRYPALHRYLKGTDGQLSKLNLEKVLCDLERCEANPFASSRRKFLSPSERRQIRDDLHAYLCRVLNPDYERVSHIASHLLVHLPADTTYITTNYDTTVDRCTSSDEFLQRKLIHTRDDPAIDQVTCPHCRLRYLLENGCACAIDRQRESMEIWQSVVLKLHGSLSWSICRTPHCRVRDCYQMDCNREGNFFRYCNCCGQMAEPGLILPGDRKRYSLHPEIHRVWDAALVAIALANHLVIFGYSFPETDEQVNDLYIEALDRNQRLQSVLILDPSAGGVAEKLRKLLPARLKGVAVECVDVSDASVLPDAYLRYLRLNRWRCAKC